MQIVLIMVLFAATVAQATSSTVIRTQFPLLNYRGDYRTKKAGRSTSSWHQYLPALLAILMQ